MNTLLKHLISYSTDKCVLHGQHVITQKVKDQTDTIKRKQI